MVEPVETVVEQVETVVEPVETVVEPVETHAQSWPSRRSSASSTVPS